MRAVPVLVTPPGRRSGEWCREHRSGVVTAGRFANLADAGRALGDRLATQNEPASSLLIAVVPNGVPVALAAAQLTGMPVAALRVVRSDSGVEVASLPDVAGRRVLVVDDGVETGTVARAVVGPLREAGAAEIVLAVPVAPRDAMADLALRYDAIVAVATPLVRRDLAWHFDAFDTIDEATAEALLAAHP